MDVTNTPYARKADAPGNWIQVKGVHRVLDPDVFDPSLGGLCALAVMTKAPRVGQVKTRLVPPLTPAEAAELNSCFLRDSADAIAEATEHVARGIAVYTPVGAEEVYADILPADFELLVQRGNGFGERLAAASEDLLQIGFGAVCLIDSDSPTVSSKIYAEAARLLSLQSDRLVLGPADDGGYYLIGLKKKHGRLFEEIDWSTHDVLKQTLERAAELNLAVEFLPTCYDVDDRFTLRRLCDELLGENGRSTINIAPATRAFLRGIIEREGRDRIWPRL
jgi:rSAM/selenodomain-associated transferase 1